MGHTVFTGFGGEGGREGVGSGVFMAKVKMMKVLVYNSILSEAL